MTPPTAEGGALRSQSFRRPTGQPVLLNGAVLRVDPATGDALPDNPAAGSSDANARRIVAYGLRNPFRFTIRPLSNDLWIGDVGWDTWEEINRQPSPTSSVVNFGWPCYEGNSPQPGYQSAGLNLCSSLYSAGTATPPYFTYNHSAHVVANDNCPTGSSSITGARLLHGREQLPGLLQRRSVLRRLREELHLVHAGRLERPAQPGAGAAVRVRRVRPGRSGDRVERRPLLRGSEHRHDPRDQVRRRGQPSADGGGDRDTDERERAVDGELRRVGFLGPGCRGHDLVLVGPERRRRPSATRPSAKPSFTYSSIGHVQRGAAGDGQSRLRRRRARPITITVLGGRHVDLRHDDPGRVDDTARHDLQGGVEVHVALGGAACSS